MLTKKENPKTHKMEHCLVSTSNGRVLEWFGVRKPSEERVEKAEARVHYFKNKRDK